MRTGREETAGDATDAVAEASPPQIGSGLSSLPAAALLLASRGRAISPSPVAARALASAIGNRQFAAMAADVQASRTLARAVRDRREIPVPVADWLKQPAYRSGLEGELEKGLGPGEPLDPEQRARAERVTDASVPNVRVHADEKSRQTVDLMNSAGMALGDHVMLGSAAVAPGLRDWILGHEIAHSIQQSLGSPNSPGGREDSSEREADTFADVFAAVKSPDLQTTVELSGAEQSLAQKVIWKYTKDLPGDLLLIVDVDDGDFVGGCVKQIVPHAGVKLIQKSPHTQIFNVHIGFLTNSKGEFCIFFYESVSGICDMKCFPSKEELKEAWDEVLEWLKDMIEKVLEALAILALIVAAAVLAALIAEALAAAVLALLALA